MEVLSIVFSGYVTLAHPSPYTVLDQHFAANYIN